MTTKEKYIKQLEQMSEKELINETLERFGMCLDSNDCKTCPNNLGDNFPCKLGIINNFTKNKQKGELKK